MVDARGTILLFMLLAQTAHVGFAQCTAEHGSGGCSERSSSYSSAKTEYSEATSEAKATSGPNGRSSTYSYAEVSGETESAYASSTASASSTSGSGSAYAHASSTTSATAENRVAEETVVVEVPDEPEHEDHVLEETPGIHFLCPKQAHPDNPKITGKTVYQVTTDGEPCPIGTVTVTTPVKPKPSTAPAAPALPVPSESDHEVTARRVKELIDSGNYTALSEFVIDSDDIYGMNMGLRFEDHEAEEEIRKTDNREEDKDVVSIKGLASAALDPDTKLKVIQLMVVTATAPDGYQFNQHRELVESFLEVFEDDELLATVIASDPETYSRRRLSCAGCTPVNSYICAHCWPKSICKTYFWCSADVYKAQSEQEEEPEEDPVEDPLEAGRKISTDTTAVSNGIESYGENSVAELPDSTEDGDEASAEPDVNELQKKKKRRRRRRRRQRKKARSNKSEDRDQST